MQTALVFGFVLALSLLALAALALTYGHVEMARHLASYLITAVVSFAGGYGFSRARAPV